MMDPNNLPHHVYLHKNHKYKLKLGFHAAPSNPKAFSKAIRDELNSLKFTYCSDLNGLIMGFGKISSNELIPADIRHCINVVVNVDVYIFRPPVGSIIEAIVNQTSDNHVSCLVHNLFNVSIVRPENEPYDQWSGSKIKKDDKINVKVLSFDLTKKLPHITGEIIKKKDDKCYDSTDIQDSSTKSSFSKNIVSDFTKSFNKITASPSKYSSSDSESSTEMTNITIPKISADKSIKISPLSINTTMKHSEKVDLTVNSSKHSLSDSESSVEMINTITSSVICNDKPVSKSSVTTNTIIQHKDTAESSSELSDSDSEFSSKIKAMLFSFKEKDKSKSSKTASHIRNSINNNKHIESPLFSSTPILNSEHSVNNINLIRNKQKDQLKKHLAKNSTEKQKSLISDEVPNQFDKDKLSQSLNILKNNNNNDNSLRVFADSVNSNENLVNDSKINQSNSQESGSNISGSELEQKNISVNNSFSKKLGKSTKKTKKHKQSNEIVNAILNSINTNKSNANIPKYLADSNNRCSEDNKKDNTVYTQHKHNLDSKIFDEEILNNRKNSNEQAVKNSLTLSLSTKNIKKKDTPQKKDTDDSKNKIKGKKLKKSLNIPLSMISDSDSNCSRDLKLAIKDLSHTTDFNEKIENETSSSDDEIYSKLRQNISKTQINTSHLNEKSISQSFPINKIYASSDESDSSSKLFFKTPKKSSKLIKSNTTKNNFVNISEPDSCQKSNDNNLLSSEKIIKKDKKKKKVNEKPLYPQLSEKIVNKMDIIKHILDNDSSSDNEEVTALKNKTSDKKQDDEKTSRKKPTLNISKINKDNEVLNKEVSNPFLKVYTTNVTNLSSDEEIVDINLMKSKKKSSGEKDIIPLVNEKKKKNILINQLLTSIKRKNKKEKLSVSQNNLNTSKSSNKLLKKDNPLLNTKNKKDVLNNISVGKPNLDEPNLNIYQKVNLSQLNTQLSSDDEKDVIKKILKKRKFKKTKKTNVLEQTMKSNIPAELNKQNEIKEKLHKKSKSQNTSMTDEVKINDVKKKKKKKDTKDLLLNSIISALDDSLIDHPPLKKKKKDHSLNIEQYDSKDKNSNANLSEVKIKKKKKSKYKEDVNLNDVTIKDKKKKSETLLESVSKNIQANKNNTLIKVTKKKKKSNPVNCKTQNLTTDKQNKINNKLENKNVSNLKNTVLSKKKTQKLLENQMKSFMETQDTSHLDSLYNLLSAHLNDKS